MGTKTDEKILAFQKNAGIEPASGERADSLGEMSRLAYDLIRIIELEKAGIRDGDGSWYGSNPLDGTMNLLVTQGQRLSGDGCNLTVGRDKTGAPRSELGKGEKVRIYVLGPASEFADSIVPAFGKISAGCGPNLGEDFAKCIWPVVIKVKTGIPDQNLVQHLRDLGDSIERRPEPRPNADDLPVLLPDDTPF